MNQGGENTKPLVGTWLTLFRAWYYLPAPLAFVFLGGQFLTLRPITIGPVLAGIGCLGVAAFFVWYSRRFEKRVGIDKVTVSAFITTFLLVVALSIVFPMMIHWFHVQRVGDNPKYTDDSHSEIPLMLHFLLPRWLMAPFLSTPKVKDSGSVSG